MRTSISHEDVAHTMTLTTRMQAVECAIQIMHSHLNEHLTLEDLASAAYLSPSHFHRIFSHATGVPPGEFLSALRLYQARRLLLTTSLSVTDICFEVGYSSIGSFTTRFTQLVGLSPRLLRQRACRFEPSPVNLDEYSPVVAACKTTRNVLQGQIRVPTPFRGTIYVGLFQSSIPQGSPVRCTRLDLSGPYLLDAIPDGVYHLRAAAFPLAPDLRSCLLPGEKMLVGSSASPLILHQGKVTGDSNLILHSPCLTDPPLVMGLPLL